MLDVVAPSLIATCEDVSRDKPKGVSTQTLKGLGFVMGEFCEKTPYFTYVASNMGSIVVMFISQFHPL